LFIEQLPANETINPFIYTAHQSIIESKRHIIPLVNGSNIQYNIDTEICTLSNDDIWEINTNYNTSIQNNGDTPAASIIVDWRVM
jgi:hypothetical protein